MRERQVLNPLVGGKTSKEIASSLGASVRTVNRPRGGGPPRVALRAYAERHPVELRT
jgi:FixJ family two-component response regulator